jgi:hypothetical protein
MQPDNHGPQQYTPDMTQQQGIGKIKPLFYPAPPRRLSPLLSDRMPRTVTPCWAPRRRRPGVAKKLYRDKTNSIPEICRMLNISRATLYRYLKT